MKSTLVALVLLGLPLGAIAESVVPTFTRGTVDSATTTKTRITESIYKKEYGTGSSYSVTGTNINIPGNPGQGANYTIQTQGAPFQFSETVTGPGLVKETWLERLTEQDSYTKSLSVFTQ